MGFFANIRPVTINPSLLDPLLAKTREILELQTCPPGRRGCNNCQRLDQLIDISKS